MRKSQLTLRNSAFFFKAWMNSVAALARSDRDCRLEDNSVCNIKNPDFSWVKQKRMNAGRGSSVVIQVSKEHVSRIQELHPYPISPCLSLVV